MPSDMTDTQNILQGLNTRLVCVWVCVCVCVCVSPKKDEILHRLKHEQERVALEAQSRLAKHPADINLERHAQFMWYTQSSNRLQSFIVDLHRFVNTRCFNGTCVGTAIILVLSVSYF